MKQISNKEYEKYQQYQTDKLHHGCCGDDFYHRQNSPLCLWYVRSGTPRKDAELPAAMGSDKACERKRLHSI